MPSPRGLVFAQFFMRKGKCKHYKLQTRTNVAVENLQVNILPWILLPTEGKERPQRQTAEKRWRALMYDVTWCNDREKMINSLVADDRSPGGVYNKMRGKNRSPLPCQWPKCARQYSQLSSGPAKRKDRPLNSQLPTRRQSLNQSTPFWMTFSILVTAASAPVS